MSDQTKDRCPECGSDVRAVRNAINISQWLCKNPWHVGRDVSPVIAHTENWNSELFNGPMGKCDCAPKVAPVAPAVAKEPREWLKANNYPDANIKVWARDGDGSATVDGYKLSEILAEYAASLSPACPTTWNDGKRAWGCVLPKGHDGMCRESVGAQSDPPRKFRGWIAFGCGKHIRNVMGSTSYNLDCLDCQRQPMTAWFDGDAPKSVKTSNRDIASLQAELERVTRERKWVDAEHMRIGVVRTVGVASFDDLMTTPFLFNKRAEAAERSLETAREALTKLKSYNEDIRDGKMNYRAQDHIQVAESVLAGEGK